MTILLLSRVFPPRQGGSGRWLWELYRRLPEHNVHVVAGEADGAAAFDQTASLPIIRRPLDFASWGLLNVTSAFQYVRGTRDLHRLIGQIRPDVVHCGTCLPEGLLAAAVARTRGTPFCCYAHGEELTLSRTSRELFRLTGAVLSRATSVFANSNHTRQLLSETWNVPRGKVTVMHPGVDTTRFAPGAADREVRERLGWAGRRVVLTVGALQKRKGQDMLIRALPAIRARCPDVLYAIAGEGWERPYLEELVARHHAADLVQFLGVPGEEELVQYYQQCDVFALPNRQVGWDIEGFGIVLLEAQACGKPVVTGRSGGTSETLRPGVTGEVVDCDAPEVLAETIAGLLTDQDRARQMGEHARQWIVERFGWERLSRDASETFRLSAPP